MTLEDKPPRLVGVQYATGEEQRNSARKNDVPGGESKVQCYKKKQYCIETWDVRSLNQGKLDVVKQELARVNINMLGISEQKWTGMGQFNPYDHYSYYCGQGSFRGNGVALIVNKSPKSSTWMQSQK